MYSLFTTENPGRTALPRPFTKSKSLFSATSKSSQATSVVAAQFHLYPSVSFFGNAASVEPPTAHLITDNSTPDFSIDALDGGAKAAIRATCLTRGNHIIHVFIRQRSHVHQSCIASAFLRWPSTWNDLPRTEQTIIR